MEGGRKRGKERGIAREEMRGRREEKGRETAPLPIHIKQCLPCVRGEEVFHLPPSLLAVLYVEVSDAPAPLEIGRRAHWSCGVSVRGIPRHWIGKNGHI